MAVVELAVSLASWLRHNTTSFCTSDWDGICASVAQKHYKASLVGYRAGLRGIVGVPRLVLLELNACNCRQIYATLLSVRYHALLANQNACTGILEAFTGQLGAADCTLKIVIGSNEARVPLYGKLKEMYISV